MALLVFLASWNKATKRTSSTTSTTSTTTSSSQYPMLVLYSTPTLPRKVAAYIEQHPDSMYASAVPERISYVVQNARWRKCGTKFAVWDHDIVNFDQVAYYDSDHIFHSNGNTGGAVGGGDAMFEVDRGNGNNTALLYAAPDRKHSSQFNAGKMLVRPDNAMCQKLVYLFNHRFWIMDWRDMIKSGDQRFLNAVFRKHWQRLDNTAASTATSEGSSANSAGFQMQVDHSKVWKLATFSSSRKNPRHNATQSMARHWIDTLELHDDLKECMQRRFAYGNQRKEKGLVEYWF